MFVWERRGMSEGKRPRIRNRWADYIKIDLKEIEWDGADCIHLIDDLDHWRALVNAIMSLRVP
jgi:hypothetical protein